MRTIFAAIRRPEYTGDRRCWPCTAVNSVLLAAICGLLAITRRRVAALCVGVGGAAAIGLCGYFVPYTPQFAPRLVGWLPGDVFYMDTPTEAGSLADETDGEAIVSALTEAGVLVADGEDLRLDEEFRERWRAEMEPLRRAETDRLASIAADHAPNAVGTRVVETHTGVGNETDSRIALEDRSGLVIEETWLSLPVVIAEIAAVRALDGAVPANLRVGAAQPLRMFLERCPACGGPIEQSTEACCGGYGPGGPDELLACADCGERVFTFPQVTNSATDEPANA